jgi:hypothetical protein
MTIITCGACGYRASADYVALTNACPNCDRTPFPVDGERGEYDHRTNTSYPEPPSDPALDNECEGCS